MKGRDLLSVLWAQCRLRMFRKVLQCAIKGAPETVHNKFTDLTDVHIWEFLKLTYYMSVSDTYH